jgi:hypothetical protein
MELFSNNFELLTFVLLAIPFVGVLGTTIAMLYSASYLQNHAALANKIFNSKNKKIGRMVLFAVLAGVANHFNWLMVETLLIAVICYHLMMLCAFKNQGFVNLSLRKY